MDRDLDIDRLITNEFSVSIAEAARNLMVEMDSLSDAIQLMNEYADIQFIDPNDIDVDTSPELDEFLLGFKVIKE